MSLIVFVRDYFKRPNVMENIDHYLINRIFSISYMDSLIGEAGVPDSFLSCVERFIKAGDTIGNAISKIYKYMDFNYRNEYFYKNTILNKLLIEKHDLYSASALTELPIGESKADFVIINGKGVIYEIKTDLDNLQRLSNQLSDYYKVFSYVYVVVGRKQLDAVKTLLEKTKVGIYELISNGSLICRKKALCDRAHLSYDVMFGVLRKQEFESIILEHYGSLPQTNDFEYYRECRKKFAGINLLTLQKMVLECLKKRTLVVIHNPDITEIPYELRCYAYFSKKQQGIVNQIKGLCEIKIGGV